MKITSLITASALALALAAPVYAQTASTGIPAALTSNSVVQQVNAQLTAQGYTITDIVSKSRGRLEILAAAPNGDLRLITINTRTGSISDTVTDGVPDSTPGITPEGTFEHESGESSAMEALENDDHNGREGGSDHGSNDDRNDHEGGSDHGSNDDRNDHEGGSDHGSNDDHNDHEGGSDHGSNDDDD